MGQRGAGHPSGSGRADAQRLLRNRSRRGSGGSERTNRGKGLALLPTRSHRNPDQAQGTVHRSPWNRAGAGASGNGRQTSPEGPWQGETRNAGNPPYLRRRTHASLTGEEMNLLPDPPVQGSQAVKVCGSPPRGLAVF